MKKKASKKKIANYFVEDHLTISKLVKSAVEKPINRERVLKKIEWHVNRHFYIEEKAFFVFLDFAKQNNPQFFRRFLSDHNHLLKLVEDIQQNPKSKKKALNLVKSLGKHVSFEVDKFYPYLEKNLDKKDKKTVIEEIEKSIDLGFYPLDKLRDYYKEKTDALLSKQ